MFLNLLFELRSLLEVGSDLRTRLKGLLELGHACRQRRRQSTNLGIVVNGLVDGEIRVRDLVTKQERAGRLAVERIDQGVVRGRRLVLVLGRLLAELLNPGGAPVDVEVRHGVYGVLLLVGSAVVFAAEVARQVAQGRDVLGKELALVLEDRDLAGQRDALGLQVGGGGRPGVVEFVADILEVDAGVLEEESAKGVSCGLAGRGRGGRGERT